MPLPDKQTVKDLMNQVNIPCVSIASVDDGKVSGKMVIVNDDNETTSTSKEPIFRAASLSKPVFAYLVYKIAMDTNVNFDLMTPLHEILEDKRFSGNEASKKLTAKFVLSHQTGLPIFAADTDLALDFQFNPGEGYGYSGVAYSYLQKVLKKLTGADLESLAQKYIFNDDALGMSNSTFQPPNAEPQKAENSLYTSATDYAIFIAACLQEKELFEIISPTWNNRDQWALGQGLTEGELQKVAWGLGWGLQLNDDKQVTHAFHLGDMGEWRAFVAIDLDKQRGIVYFSNSKNGLMLADKIITPIIDLKDAAKYMYQKYGFSRDYEEDFEEKEELRINTIIGKYCSRMFNTEIISDMLSNQLMFINNNAGKGMLDIQVRQPNLLTPDQSRQWKRFINLILQELEEFKHENNITTNDCSSYERDNNSDVVSLRIHKLPSTMYDNFIEHLANKNLLPAQNIKQEDNIEYQQGMDHFTTKPFLNKPSSHSNESVIDKNETLEQQSKHIVKPKSPSDPLKPTGFD